MFTDLTKIAKLVPISSDPRLQRGFSQIIHHMIITKSCIMSEWARSAYNFSAFIKKCYRFFRNTKIDWNINETILQFTLHRFEKKKFIPVLIDPSFVENKVMGSPTKTKKDQQKCKDGFFLLSAALPVKGRAISFFQAFWRNTQITYRVYDSINKLLSIQLIKIAGLLKSVASKVVFVMDRGFGYEFFIRKCLELNVKYVIRIRDSNTHVVMARGKKEYSIQELINRAPQGTLCHKVWYKGSLYINLVINKKGNSSWAIASNISNPDDVVKLYSQRMKIEEVFKDWKSTGFNIEKLQIRQWDILPKIIWCVVVAHLLLYLFGEIIERTKKYKFLLKKITQNKNSLSRVQLAWKAWRFALDDLLPLFQSLYTHLFNLRKAYL